jgi:hypothetical protein
MLLVTECIEEIVHRSVLVHRARKVLREAASAEDHCDLRITSSAADASDPGTCEIMEVW